MTADAVCSQATDPRKLVRDGTNQGGRARPDPAAVPVDERRPEHALVFAAGYAQFLDYVGPDGVVAGDWQKFFNSDLSAQLAVAAIENVSTYRTTVKALLRALEDPPLSVTDDEMIKALGAVFDCLGTLARRLDELKEALPREQPLRATLSNLIRSQLSPMLRQLIGYHRAGQEPDVDVVKPDANAPGEVRILGKPVERFKTLGTNGLSSDWPAGVQLNSWASYVNVDPAAVVDRKRAFGSGPTKVDKVNHFATHNVFAAICETFLGVFARVVDDSKVSLEASYQWDGHEPHYSLFLSFLQLFEHARDAANAIPAKHLDFYYRDVLRLREREALPTRAHVLVELAKRASTHLVEEGTLLKAGKDDRGADAHFAVDRDLVANKASVAQRRSLYRHRGTDGPAIHRERIFASTVANSADGQGAKLTSPDRSWPAFANAVYVDGSLTDIAMPKAEVGFVVASHHLWLAEGARTITLTLGMANIAHGGDGPLPVDLRCRLSTADGWLEATHSGLEPAAGGFSLQIELDGNAPAVTAYNPKVHGHAFETDLPVLVVTLPHSDATPWRYADLEDAELTSLELRVEVTGLKTLDLSNDHGAIDSSKPFQAFGSAPMANSSVVIGSKEAFQKHPEAATINVEYLATPKVYAASAPAAGTAPPTLPGVTIEYLDQGTWTESAATGVVGASSYELEDLPWPDAEHPDFTVRAPYSTASRSGFVRLRLDAGFGTESYPGALAAWLVRGTGGQPVEPVVPTVTSLTLDYAAEQVIAVGQAAASRQYFHLTPFGHAMPAPLTATGGVFLLPRFRAGAQAAEAELYIGVVDLEPPQNLALLFQVVDGTANPLVVKPEGHIHWSYLRGDEWVDLPADAVDDATHGLLMSGITTLAVPADASTTHTLLPPGQHWIRLAVASASDAVCRLLSVEAQALRATSVVRDDGSSWPAGELAAKTITKLDQPHQDVKGVTQPFPSFGGRPAESPSAFATRVSERLRHKDRAIALWDYEHLILEAFPFVYQARCLNHTRYEPSATGGGIYRELAPGHVTVVTIPDLAVPNPRDPLRPYTSLRELNEIERFLAERMSCFTKLHVRNPQFEEVVVDLRVRFRDGEDETFRVNSLKQEITRFLSPWAFRSDVHPTFNGKIRKSVLVDFVDERPYVDYVADVHLVRKDSFDGSASGTSAEGPDPEELEGSRAVSILVSAPAAEHRIRPIHPDETVVAENCACGPGAV